MGEEMVIEEQYEKGYEIVERFVYMNSVASGLNFVGNVFLMKQARQRYKIEYQSWAITTKLITSMNLYKKKHAHMFNFLTSWKMRQFDTHIMFTSERSEVSNTMECFIPWIYTSYHSLSDVSRICLYCFAYSCYHRLLINNVFDKA